MKRRLLFGLVVMIALIVASPSQAADKSKSEQAFDRLTSIKGEWKGEPDGVKTTLIYTLTADGSVLMEQCRPEGGPEMITMFTVDGDHLIATHYCAAKNQPQMVTSAITDAQKSLVFSLARITGLKSPNDFHNTGLTVTIEDTQHLTQVWTYEYKGKKGTNTFRFTRTG
jgi:alpha-amylase/alpha-mannosidase (GH57 family)